MKSKLFIDYDLIQDSFFTKYEIPEDYLLEVANIPFSIGMSGSELDMLRDLHYFIMRTSMIPYEGKLGHETKQRLAQLTYQMIYLQVIKKEQMLPYWFWMIQKEIEFHISFIQEIRDLFSEIRFKFEYSNIPFVRMTNNKEIIISAVQMPFMTQVCVAFQTLLNNTNNDRDKFNEKLRSTFFPILSFQSDPLLTPLSFLPELYSINETQYLIAKEYAHLQMIFICLHELGHMVRKHKPGQNVEDISKDENGSIFIKIGNAHLLCEDEKTYKEIDADKTAYMLFLTWGKYRFQTIHAAITSLFYFYCVVERAKNKRKGQDISYKLKMFENRLQAAEVFFSAISTSLEPVVEEDKSEANKIIEEDSSRYLQYVTTMLTKLIQEIDTCDEEEFREICRIFTIDGYKEHRREKL